MLPRPARRCPLTAPACTQGPRDYFADDWNRFDFIVAVGSLTDVHLPAPTAGVTVLRIFRLLRIFKLAQSWQSLRSLIETIVRSLPGIGNFVCMLALFLIMFSLMGAC